MVLPQSEKTKEKGEYPPQCMRVYIFHPNFLYILVQSAQIFGYGQMEKLE